MVMRNAGLRRTLRAFRAQHVGGSAVLLLLGLCAPLALASPWQESVLPAVADSPTAQSLVEQMRAQSIVNPAEAAHIARRLLDEFGARIVQVGDAEEGRFVSVAEEVETLLLAVPEVMSRFLRSESEEADRLLAQDGPQSIAARRRWTSAGLTASLLLAQDALRAGQFARAVVVLERVRKHPMLTDDATQSSDVVGRRAEYLALLSMSLRASGESASSLHALAALEQLAARVPTEQRVATARDAARQFHAPPKSVHPASAVTGGQRAALPDAAWRRVFTATLDDSLFLRYYGAETLARLPEHAAERARADASWLTAEPTVFGDTIYVSEGRTLRAFDATTARERWSVELALAGTGRETGIAVDLSSVAIHGFDAAVIAGNGFSNARTDGGRVFLVDVRDGTQRWSLSVDALEGRTELMGAYPIGSPIIAGDVVLVTVRRPSTRLEQADSVLALARSDGSIRWLTLAAAAGGTRAVSVRRAPGMIVHDGALYVSTPLGAVARLRMSDGAIEWLRRFRVPLREPRFSGEAWEFARPLVLAGLVYSVAPDESEVVALDADTGETHGVAVIGPGTAWGSPRSLVSGDGLIIAVGSDVIAFDPSNLATPRWKLSETEVVLWEAREGRDNRGGIRGRVSIAGDLALVPGVTALWFVELATGRRVATLETGEPVNAVLVEDRVVAVGVDHVDVYMSGLDAVKVLRARLDSAQDASAALVLFDLAIEGGDLALALDAAQRASLILKSREGDPLRALLADRLVEHAPAAGGLGERFFALAAELVDDAQLRVRLAFARAEWFARRGDAPAAIEAWREIAATDAENVALLETGAVRATRAVALPLLAQFLAQPDQVEAANAYELLAANALREVSSPLTAASCIAIVQSFPRSRAGAEAARAGAEILKSQDQLRARDALIDMALREAHIAPERKDLIALLAGSATAHVAAIAPPQIGAPTFTVTEIPGRLVRRAFQAFDAGAQKTVYVMEEFDLVARDTKAFEERWRFAMHDRDPVLLADGATLVLMESGKGRAENYIAIDRVTGAELWRTPSGEELFGALARADGDLNALQVLPEGAPFFAAQVLPMIAGGRLVLVRRDGEAASFAPRAGTRTIAHDLLPQVYATAGDEDLLALGGRSAPERFSQPTVLLCDPVSLVPFAQFATASGGDVRWIRRSSFGVIAIGTTAGIEMWTLQPSANGVDARFLMGVADARSWDSTSPVWCDGRLFALDRNGQLLTVDLWSAGVAEVGFGDGPAGYARVVRAISRFGSGLVAHADSRIALVDAAAHVIGRDGTTGDPNFIAAIIGADRIVLVNGIGARQAPNAKRTALVSEYVYILTTADPAQGLRLTSAPIEVRSINQRFSRTIAADGWVLLSNDSSTLIVGF
ncbi:MAG: hypothetical protein EXS10_00185 [Phycisphaerales bacterium]|nr:hypothetical protein [Phycisphaerales bacterium]